MRVRHNPNALPALKTLPFFIEGDKFDFTKLDTAKYSEIAVEIGVGKGDYLLEMSLKFPDVLFIGIEFNTSILFYAAMKLIDLKTKNIYLVNGDAQKILELFPIDTLNYLILNHSDPWPKKRHEKRRLTHPLFLELYQNLLKKDGKLLIKTDNDDFARYTLEVLNASSFWIKKHDLDYRGDEEFDAMTEYQRKFLKKGVKIKRIEAVK